MTIVGKAGRLKSRDRNGSQRERMGVNGDGRRRAGKAATLIHREKVLSRGSNFILASFALTSPGPALFLRVNVKVAEQSPFFLFPSLSSVCVQSSFVSTADFREILRNSRKNSRSVLVNFWIRRSAMRFNAESRWIYLRQTHRSERVHEFSVAEMVCRMLEAPRN